jgi:uncharacterized protein YeaO (DUF488 family)
MPGSLQIVPKSVYDSPNPQDGVRVLLSNFWPPGIKKTDAHIDHWMQNLAPSSDLYAWFSHTPDKWPEFKQRYFQELDTNQEAVKQLLDIVSQQKVTLVFSIKDQKFNPAVVLKEYLEMRMRA